MVKIIKNRHSKGHISQKKHDLKIIFMQKQSLYCCGTCTKFSSFCWVIIAGFCLFLSLLWKTFSRNALYVSHASPSMVLTLLDLLIFRLVQIHGGKTSVNTSQFNSELNLAFCYEKKSITKRRVITLLLLSL